MNRLCGNVKPSQRLQHRTGTWEPVSRQIRCSNKKTGAPARSRQLSGGLDIGASAGRKQVKLVKRKGE